MSFAHPFSFSDPDYTKKLCDTWPPKYEPTLSSFHPSAMILANILKNSIPVSFLVSLRTDFFSGEKRITGK